MKYRIPFVVLALLFTACGTGETTEEGAIPQDLDGKRALLREKKAELKELTALIALLEDSIAVQDPATIRKQGRLVTTLPVVRNDFNHYVEIQGAVEADDLVDVTSEVNGRILKLTVAEGDNVNAGQLIAELDLEQVETQISEVETSLELAKTVFERQARLWEQNIGSEMQYLEAKNNKERLEKNLETMKVKLNKSKVYAPAYGVFDRVALQSGEVSSPGMPIVQILNTSRLKVVADVQETYLQSVKRGEEVTIRLPALDREYKLRVSQIGRTIDPANRTFKVEVNIGNPGGALKPNLLATMLINDHTEEDVVVVPLEIVQQEVGGRNYVFITGEGEDGEIAKKVYVTTGRSYEGNVVIQKGLAGGETLIMDGARGMVENEKIKIVNAKTEANNG